MTIPDQAIGHASKFARKSPVPAEEPIPRWLGLFVILCALLLATGAVIALVKPAMLVSPQDPITAGVRVYAGYLFARNLAVAIVLLAALALGARQALAGLLALNALIQFLDTLMDCIEGRWPIAPGVLFLGLICLLAAARLSGHTPFRRAAIRVP